MDEVTNVIEDKVTNVTEDEEVNVIEDVITVDDNNAVFTEPDRTTTVKTEVSKLPEETVTITVPRDISSLVLIEYLDGQIKDIDEKICSVEAKMAQLQDTLDIFRKTRNEYMTWYDALKPFK